MLDEPDIEYEEDLEGGKLRIFSRNGWYQVRIYRGGRSYLYKSLRLAISRRPVKLLLIYGTTYASRLISVSQLGQTKRGSG